MYYNNSEAAIRHLSLELIKEAMIRSSRKAPEILIHGTGELSAYGNMQNFKELIQDMPAMQSDVIVSNLELLFCEDINTELLKYRALLKERSLFILTSLTANLHELIKALIVAQQKVEKCAYDVFVHMPSLSNLISVAASLGFGGTVSYTERIQVDYSSFQRMLVDLAWLLRMPLKEDVIQEAEKVYAGQCSISFDVLILSSLLY